MFRSSLFARWNCINFGITLSSTYRLRNSKWICILSSWNSTFLGHELTLPHGYYISFLMVALSSCLLQVLGEWWTKLLLTRFWKNSLQWSLWIADTYGSLKICPLLRVGRYWEVILKRLLHLGLKGLSAIHGMSAIWDVRYWKVSMYE